ncbi:MAG: hypothetical protein SFZ23_07095 [Planctomycetota bacterium]|nr:hypothetical protein [Planctomycetota bacterium]
MKRSTTLLVAGLSLALVPWGEARAEVTMASKGKFAGGVKVRGKAPNTRLTVTQSSKPGGDEFVDTGSVIDTDASGNGSVGISNASAGTLLTGHTIRVGGNTRQVIRSRAWFPAGFAAGMNIVPCDIPTAVVANDPTSETFVEAWRAGAIVTIALDAGEASFDPGRTPTIVGDGDLVATLLSVASDRIRVRIISDGAFTLDDLRLSNLGIDVVPGVGLVTPYIGLDGTVDCYAGTEFIASETLTSAQLFAGPSIPVPAPASLAFLGTSMMLAEARSWRRRSPRA